MTEMIIEKTDILPDHHILQEEIVGKEIGEETEKILEIEDNIIIMIINKKELTDKEAIWVKNNIMIIMSIEEMIEIDNIVVMVNLEIHIKKNLVLMMSIDLLEI
jgi:hypothetical protein